MGHQRILIVTMDVETRSSRVAAVLVKRAKVSHVLAGNPGGGFRHYDGKDTEEKGEDVQRPYDIFIKYLS